MTLHLEAATLRQRLTTQVLPTAAGAAATVPALIAPYDGFIFAADYLPNAPMTGGAGGGRLFTLTNTTTPTAGGIAATAALDGTNNVPPAGRLILSVPAGPNVTPPNSRNNYDGNNVLAAAPIPTAASVKAGDVLAWQTAPTGAGVPDPGGVVEVTIQRISD